MAGRFAEMTPARIAKLDREGRGIGGGKHYKPWLRTTEVPTSGYMNRWFGIKTGRVHHLLSNIEANVLPLAEFDARVTDIREQYPLLPLARTVLLAKSFGFRHPRRRTGGNTIVMTTDFVMSLPEPGHPDRQVAISVKPSTDFERPRARRIREKLLIEDAYWAAKGIGLLSVTEKDFSTTVVLNLAWLRDGWLGSQDLPHAKPKTSPALAAFAGAFKRTRSASWLEQRIDTSARKLGECDGHTLFRRAVWLRLIPLDLRVPILLDRPAVLTDEPNLGVTFPW